MFVCFLVISRLSFRFFQLTRTIYTLYCLRVIPQGKRARPPNAEVKPNPAWLELGWVTDKKILLVVRHLFCLPYPFLFFFSLFYFFLCFFLSLLFLRTKPLVDISIITMFYYYFLNFITKNMGSAGFGGSAGFAVSGGSARSVGSAVCSSSD